MVNWQFHEDAATIGVNEFYGVALIRTDHDAILLRIQEIEARLKFGGRLKFEVIRYIGRKG
jgi:hypothetical protein